MSDKIPNPLINKSSRIPGEYFQLPSRGAFYAPGVLDPSVEEGRIEILPMTLADELVLKNPDLLFNGEAITRVFARCVPHVLSPLELFTSDVDFILVCLRKVSQGKFIPIKYKHPCKGVEKEDHVEHEYLIPVDHFIQTTKPINPADKSSYTFNLKGVFQVVLKHETFGELIKFRQYDDSNINETNTEEYSKYISSSILNRIESVDGITDRDQIFEWLVDLRKPYRDLLLQKIIKNEDWGTTFKYTIKCKECNEAVELVTALNPVDFFMLPSSPEMLEE